MKINAAPIIHGRTKSNDFPSSTLLVAPSDFDNSDILWAKRKITDSTRFFEIVSDEGRRIVFSNSKVIVSGISIKIDALSKLCRKESEYAKVNSSRINYAFIGFAIPKSEISDTFDVPYTLFLEQYEKWMGKLWNTEYQKNGMFCTKSEYVQLDFPDAEDVCSNIKMNNSGKLVIVDSSVAPIECITARAMEFAINSNDFSFCSNITMKKIVDESCFNMITSSKAASIAAEIPGSILMAEKYVQHVKKPPKIITDSPSNEKTEASTFTAKEEPAQKETAASAVTAKDIPKKSKTDISSTDVFINEKEPNDKKKRKIRLIIALIIVFLALVLFILLESDEQLIFNCFCIDKINIMQIVMSLLC